MYENVPQLCNENAHQALLCRKQMTRVEHELAKALIPFLKNFAPWKKMKVNGVINKSFINTHL